MTRKSHLRLASLHEPSDLSALIFWKNEAKRLKERNRALTEQIRSISRDRLILWKAWQAVTRGEQERILKLASGMTDDEFLAWLVDLPIDGSVSV